MARGQLDPMAAMMRGKLKIQGDMSVAMKLQAMLRGQG
jgi:putative sterol carrier protein